MMIQKAVFIFCLVVIPFVFHANVAASTQTQVYFTEDRLEKLEIKPTTRAGQDYFFRLFTWDQATSTDSKIKYWETQRGYLKSEDRFRDTFVSASGVRIGIWTGKNKVRGATVMDDDGRADLELIHKDDLAAMDADAEADLVTQKADCPSALSR